MGTSIIRLFIPGIFISFALVSLCFDSQAQKSDPSFSPVIPRAWDDAELASLEVPLANPINSPKHISADYYYRIPVRKIYRSYPVYAPGKEPPGYMDWLKQQEPEIAFDPARLKTEADWTKAGELVFDAPITYDTVVPLLAVRDPEWYRRTGVLLSKEGTLPSVRYVVREKGKVEVGNLSCAMCHTRVMPDGSVVKGAQGNFPFDRSFALNYRSGMPVEFVRRFERFLFGAPWLRPDPQAQLDRLSIDEIASAHEAIPPGVIARHRTSVLYPVQVPDLIGVRERRYLDRTGLQLHRSIEDMMRYAALNQGGDDLAHYGEFSPAVVFKGKYPEPNTESRYSDEQLYAMALYIYALKPPPNPNKFDALAEKGKQIFRREGCAGCHTPPLYTSNKLTPAEGFKPPDSHLKRYDILPISIGTDPNLALRTRRGTGYYKVPSLKGVWYRGPFEHSGSVATLEDWFDPRRLRDDYVPTGYKGLGVKTRAVKGHEFGLTLSVEDKKALIAFLKTI